MRMHDERHYARIGQDAREGIGAAVVAKCGVCAAIVGLIAAIGLHSENIDAGDQALAQGSGATSAPPRPSPERGAAGYAEQRPQRADAASATRGFLISEAEASERRTVVVDEETMLRRASD